MKRLIFLLIIILVIVYFQYMHIHDFKTSYEILQYENPNKDIFENIMQDKLISVFTYIPFDISIKNSTYKYSDFKKDILEKNNNINEIIKENLSYYDIPLNISNTIDINFKLANSKTKLSIQKNFRSLFYQLEGTKRFFIFSPEHYKNLYFLNNTTLVDFWNQDLDRYPLINNAKYIEIILHPQQMLSIPMGWLWCSIIENDSLSINYTSESLFSYVLK
jgi:hypothetical protein